MTILFFLQILAFLWAIAHSFRFVKTFIVPRIIRRRKKPHISAIKLRKTSKSVRHDEEVPCPSLSSVENVAVNSFPLQTNLKTDALPRENLFLSTNTL